MIRTFLGVLVALAVTMSGSHPAGAQQLQPADDPAGTAAPPAAAVQSGAGTFVPRGLITPGGESPALVAPQAFTAPIVYLCDSGGRLATINLNTGQVTVIGRMGVVLTDIGFAPDGTLFGLTYSRFYRINAATAAAAPIGSGLGVGGMNALTFNKSGQAIAASNSRQGFYLINRATGRASYGGDNGPFTSAGDFAYNGVHLYFSANGRKFVDYNFSTRHYVFHPVSLSNLYGLVVPQQGAVVGFAGTRAYRLNTATGASTLLFDFAGKGLTQVYGAASKRLF